MAINQDRIGTRRSQDKEKLLAEFRKMPIVQIACDRASISRSTYYRWVREDDEFSEAATTAIAEGKELFNDKSEAQLLTLVNEKHFGAIKHYLAHNSDKYSAKGAGGRPDKKIRVIILHDHED